MAPWRARLATDLGANHWEGVVEYRSIVVLDAPDFTSLP
jgi:hypothetical protein